MRKLKCGPDPIIALRKWAHRFPRGRERRWALRQVGEVVRLRAKFVDEILYGAPGSVEPVGLFGRSPLADLVNQVPARTT
jgi:hypothetical protein